MKISNRSKHCSKSGMTLVEIIVVLTIMAIIFGIGTYTLVSARKSATLNTLTDSVASTLEQARSSALSGKGGVSYGVKFASTSYTYFASPYVQNDPDNRTSGVSTGFELSNTYTSNGGIVIFSRLTGAPQATGTITIINMANTSQSKMIQIGSQGDITVVK
jgi:prepilin-type N-terminal cleavage/methylation domain-containing protein